MSETGIVMPMMAVLFKLRKNKNSTKTASRAPCIAELRTWLIEDSIISDVFIVSTISTSAGSVFSMVLICSRTRRVV